VMQPFGWAGEAGRASSLNTANVSAPISLVNPTPLTWRQRKSQPDHNPALSNHSTRPSI